MPQHDNTPIMQEGANATRQVDNDIIRQTNKTMRMQETKKRRIHLYVNTITRIQWHKKARTQ